MDDNFYLNGKVALITGGASGIGAAIAQAFDKRGVTSALVDLNQDAVEQQAKSLFNAHAYTCNVADKNQVQSTINTVVNDLKKIDILLNCAGIVDLAPAQDISYDAWQRTIDINLTGSFLTCQAVGKHMIANQTGKIINLASQAASVAIEEHVAYCSSKFAIIGLTKTLALEWGQYGITVNSISPTVVMTELGKKAWYGEKAEKMKALIPTGRFAEPEEIAAAAVFLASDGADMINGADLLIDGGFTVK